MHVIRLRGPWNYEVVARTQWLADGSTARSETDLPGPGQVQMPCTWQESLGEEFRGRVRYIRRFGRPTNLEPRERVELVIGCIDAFGTVTLNDRHLADVPAGAAETRLDVTHLLQVRNELAIDVELPQRHDGAPPLARAVPDDQPGGLVGTVALEISP